jgi:hypothetical protein
MDPLVTAAHVFVNRAVEYERVALIRAVLTRTGSRDLSHRGEMK